MPYRKGMGKVQKYIGRVVVVFTPLFVALAAWAATQVERLPGAPQLDQTEVVSLLVLGAGSALGAVITWLVNLGKHERQKAAHDAVNERDTIARQHELARVRAEQAPIEGVRAELEAIVELGRTFERGLAAAVERLDGQDDRLSRFEEMTADAPPEAIIFGGKRYEPAGRNYSPIPSSAGGDGAD